MLQGRTGDPSPWLVGVLGTLVIAATLLVLPESLPSAVPALLLLVPICLASALGGWRVGVSIAVLGALVYSIAFIPPFGSLPLQLTEDLYVLAAFVGVAVMVGVLAGRDRTTAYAAVVPDPLLDDDRAMLLRSVSHDLRTPLSTIQTVSTELLDGQSYSAEAQRELMGIVASEATRLNRIVGNLLSISRVQAGSFQPALEPTPVAPLVKDAIARVAVNSDQVIVIAAEVDDDLPDALADPVQIDQVLANLIENSLRHAPGGSTVVVSATMDGEFVRVTVSDEGPGFAPEALEFAFTAAPTRPGRPTGGGTGLGLTVCKAIVEAHDGEIGVETRPVGASVSFTLPAVAAA